MTKQKTTTERRRTAGLPFRILGWLAGALSLVNLIRDLDWVEISGALDDWIVGYAHVVESVRDFLFGWIPVSWLEVSTMEAHCLVILSVLLSSNIKAGLAAEEIANTTGVSWAEENTALLTPIPSSQHKPAPPGSHAALVAAKRYGAWLGLATLTALLIPGGWSLWPFVGISLAVVVFRFILGPKVEVKVKTGQIDRPSWAVLGLPPAIVDTVRRTFRRDFTTNVVGISGIAAIVVLVGTVWK